jgi:hypothetical protein
MMSLEVGRWGGGELGSWGGARMQEKDRNDRRGWRYNGIRRNSAYDVGTNSRRVRVGSGPCDAQNGARVSGEPDGTRRVAVETFPGNGGGIRGRRRRRAEGRQAGWSASNVVSGHWHPESPKKARVRGVAGAGSKKNRRDKRGTGPTDCDGSRYTQRDREKSGQ